MKTTNIHIGNNPNNAKIQFSQTSAENGLLFINCSIDFEEKISPETIDLYFPIFCPEAYSQWSPTATFNRGIRANWAWQKADSRFAYGAPVVSLIAADNSNAATIALSDAAVPHTIATGYVEDNGEVTVNLRLFVLPIAPIDHYEVTVRIDSRPMPYYEAIPEVERWWASACGYTPATVPDAAKWPLDSLWYSFHKELSADKIILECEESKKLGMDTVIIDDGWQTDSNKCGYAFCGDWECAASKIPDMTALVDRLHEIGMKVMIWFSVPYIGVESKNFERFKGMLLEDPSSPTQDTFCLDPRYKEVREFLVQTYVNAVKNYHLDGLKLDFIDSFLLTPHSIKDCPGRDIYALEDSIDTLLSQVMTELKKINPDIMIEFRQNYIGPKVRQYGNMLRVGDCPGDPLRNRVCVFDLRLLSGKTAVHSDMLMWMPEEKAEHAALQLLAVFFSVPQISVYLPNMPQDHKRMLQHYLGVWREYRDTLLGGALRVYDPEANYSLAEADDGNTLLAVRYGAVPLTVKNAYERIVFINGKDARTSVIETAVDLTGKTCYIYNCYGDLQETRTLGNESLIALPIPTAGMAVIA